MQIDALRPWTRVSQTFAICGHPFPFLFLITLGCYYHRFEIIVGDVSRKYYSTMAANFFVIIFLGIFCFDLNDVICIIVEPDSIRFVDI